MPRSRLATAFAATVGLFLAAAVGTLAGAARQPDETWYWERPIPPQGPVPDTHLGPARGLAPTDCAGCHPRQFEDWKTSLHAGAFSPGLEWQLIEMGPADRASCLSCHAPLHEQLETDAAGRRSQAFHPALRSAGVTCAACHVRGHVRHGPLRIPGHDPGITATGKPHGEVIRSTFFSSAQFCAACHQFPPDVEAPAGKPLENTVAEWQASRFAARGMSCQSCHMPDRRHLWRGIHDPEMVRRGLRLELADSEARLTSTGVGHMFPTYVTPRAVLEVETLDRAGRTIARRSAVMQRVVDLRATPAREISDTRLPPGATRAVRLPQNPRAVRIRAKLVVQPDHFYEGQFAASQRYSHSARVRALLAEALRRTRKSSFVALRAERRIGPGPAPERSGADPPSRNRPATGSRR